MRKRFQIALVVLTLAVCVGFVWAILRAREPSYEGKPLSYWLDEYNKLTMVRYRVPLPERVPEPEAKEKKIKVALQKIGTNAVPFLVKMARAQNSPLKKKILPLAARQKIIPVHFHAAEEYQSMAVLGFSVLHDAGRDAAPALVELLKSPDQHTRLSAADCLGNIGPDAKAAVPILLQSINDTNRIVQFDTLVNLGRIHMEPEAVVPALIQKLISSNGNLDMTILTLGEYGEKAKPAVPYLRPFLDQTNDAYLRWRAEGALRQISPGTVFN